MRTDPGLLARMLAVSFLLGAALSVGNDLLVFLRLLIPMERKRKVPEMVLQTVQDILFCLTAFSAITVIFYYYNDGIARGFAILAMIVGFLGWRVTLGKMFRAVFGRLAVWLRKKIRYVCHILWIPVFKSGVFVGKMLRKPVVLLFGRIKENRIQRYDIVRRVQMKKLSEKGFVK